MRRRAVALGVVQRLLRDAQHRQLDGVGRAARRARDDEIRAYRRVRAEIGEKALHRRGEAEIVEQRRTYASDEDAQLLDDLFGVVAGLVEAGSDGG